MQTTQTLLSNYLLCFYWKGNFISINYYYIKRRKLENSRTCEICDVKVHRASFVKHLRSRKHLENIRQNEMIMPEWLFKQEQTPIKKITKSI